MLATHEARDSLRPQKDLARLPHAFTIAFVCNLNENKANSIIFMFCSFCQANEERLMKWASSKQLTSRQRAELKALAALRDDAIDTADSPDLLDCSGAKRGPFYRLVKSS